MALKIHLICVGKTKEKSILQLESDYLKRIKSPILKIYEVKSHSENLNLEAEEVLKKISHIEKNGKAFVNVLAEIGKERDSKDFSSFLDKNIQNGKDIIFVIGGASGHGQGVLDRADDLCSLSKLTFPHKIARLLFVEQIYRAQTIREGHPYHK